MSTGGFNPFQPMDLPNQYLNMEPIQLKVVAIYKDGGSQLLHGPNGEKYWRNFKRLEPSGHYGKIFVGNIGDKERVLATGTFMITNPPMGKRCGSIETITQ